MCDNAVSDQVDIEVTAIDVVVEKLNETFDDWILAGLRFDNSVQVQIFHELFEHL